MLSTRNKETTMQTEDPADYLGDETQLEECRFLILSQLKAGKSLPSFTDCRRSRRDYFLPDRLPVNMKSQRGWPRFCSLQNLKGRSNGRVFDRDLVEKVLEEHHLPQSLALRFMPTEKARRSYA